MEDGIGVYWWLMCVGRVKLFSLLLLVLVILMMFGILLLLFEDSIGMFVGGWNIELNRVVKCKYCLLLRCCWWNIRMWCLCSVCLSVRICFGVSGWCVLRLWILVFSGVFRGVMWNVLVILGLGCWVVVDWFM